MDGVLQVPIHGKVPLQGWSYSQKGPLGFRDHHKVRDYMRHSSGEQRRQCGVQKIRVGILETLRHPVHYRFVETAEGINMLFVLYPYFYFCLRR